MKFHPLSLRFTHKAMFNSHMVGERHRRRKTLTEGTRALEPQQVRLKFVALRWSAGFLVPPAESFCFCLVLASLAKRAWFCNNFAFVGLFCIKLYHTLVTFKTRRGSPVDRRPNFMTG